MPIPEQPPTTTPPATGFAALMRPTQLGGAVDSGASLLAASPNHRFFLRHHPSAWRVSSRLEKPTWIPDIAKHILAPGVNGVRTIRKGETAEASYRNSVRDAMDKGWSYLDAGAPIPAEYLPPGVPVGGYIRELECADPLTRRRGTYYLEAWQIPVESLPDERQRFEYDLSAHERYAAWLVLSGQLRPVLPQVIERLISSAGARLERAQQLRAHGKATAEFVALREEWLTIHESAELPSSAPKAKPPTKRRRRKKATAAK